MATTLVRIQQRRKTAAAWTSSAEVLLAGELGIETDTLKVKIGDGVTAWAALAYHGVTAAPSGTAGGDLTGSYPNPALATAGTAGTYGSASAIPVITTDSKGRVTSVTTATPAGGTATDSTKLAIANNLSDLGSAATARTNLGLKSGATTTITVSTTAPSSPAVNDLWVDAS